MGIANPIRFSLRLTPRLHKAMIDHLEKQSVPMSANTLMLIAIGNYLDNHGIDAAIGLIEDSISNKEQVYVKGEYLMISSLNRDKDYEIKLDDLKTHDDFYRWLLHLIEKKWFTKNHLLSFVHFWQSHLHDQV